MWNIQNNEITISGGRLTVEGLVIGEGAGVCNEAEVFTCATVSEGSITGRGTWWTHVSSKAVGGFVAPLQTIIYYGAQVIRHRYLQLMSGSFETSKPSGNGSVLS